MRDGNQCLYSIPRRKQKRLRLNIMNTENPSIDIIILTYRRPQFLKREIESLLNQSYPDFNIYIYDDASNDETGDMVREFMEKDLRVHYHCHKSNMGMVRNYNFGLSKVQASFFTIQSDDDYFHPDFFKNAIDEFRKYADSMFVSLSTPQVNSSGKIICRPSINKVLEGFYLPPNGLLKMLQVGLLNWAGIVFRRQLIDKVGKLSENQRFAIDLDYLVRVCAHHPFRISSKPGAFFTEHDNSVSSICKFDWIWPSYLEIIDVIAKDSSISEEIRKKCTVLLQKRLKGRLIYTFMATLRHKNKDDSFKTLSVLSNYFNSNITVIFLKMMMKIYYKYPTKLTKIIDLITRKKPQIVFFLEKLGYMKTTIFQKK